ncbi:MULTISPECIES: hypothetical protein [Paenibacillus]|uniref:DUF3854 domain-containing protein n=1 Tax=Paenibacillus odorifer TaxID=189426 RepID=A0A1R0X0R0_9BACL|nr:hypothetical protein [Paenibacillus odorifer]OMD26264.1 hypothetical protein BJP51_27680 [Paenibacillus odorifer]OME28852.1 hypothetical protein BSK63_23355 [Paenibacillus odorifer]
MKLRSLRRQPGWYEIQSVCPICGHEGWCAINHEQTIVRCMRVPSDDYIDTTMGRQYKHYLDPDALPKTNVEIMYDESIDKKSNSHLNEVYRTMIEEMSLSSDHLYHLRNVRQFSDKEIQLRQYRTMPNMNRHKIAKAVINRVSDQNDLLGVPGFFAKEGTYGSYWTMAGAAGLMIPFRSITNEITGWQIRVDDPPLELVMAGAIKGEIMKELEPNQFGMRRARCRLYVQGKELEVILTEKDKKECYSKSKQFVFSVVLKQGLRYWWWSSGSKKNGSSIGNPLPYHLALPTPCLPYWNIGEMPTDIIDCSEVWITEGPIKADKGAEALLKPFIGLPGIGTYSLILDVLKELGCKHIVIAFDADIVTTPQVQQTLGLCAEFFAKNTDMSLSLAMWDITLGKGIDDLVDNGYLPQLTAMIE